MPNESSHEILDKFKESVILLHGIFEPSFFDFIKDKGHKDIFVLEGRPSLDAAEDTCRELIKRKMHPTLIADNMMGFTFYKNLVKEAWIAYETFDEESVLTHIGGLIIGVLANKHNINVNAYAGRRLGQLLGHEKEIFHFNGTQVAPKGIRGYVPLVEWVPRKYITQIYEK